MAKNQTPNLQDMKKELDRMRAEIAALEIKQAAIDARKQAVDLANTSAAIKELQAIDADARGLESVLPALKQRHAQLQADYDAAVKVDTAQRAAVLFARREAQDRKTVAALVALEKELDASGEIDAETVRLGAFPRGQNWGTLHLAVMGTSDYLRHHSPELVGLPPLPSPEAKAKADALTDARARVERHEKLIAGMEAQQSTAHGEFYSSIEESIRAERQNLQRAQKELAALQGA